MVAKRAARGRDPHRHGIESRGDDIGKRVSTEVAQRLGNEKQHDWPSDEPAGGVDEPIKTTRRNQTGDAKK
jgi:hypothetical protein